MASTSEAIINLQNNTATLNANQTAQSTSKSNTTVDSQAFLKLMTMQLQYQDPTNPLDNSEMLAQEAQFSTLEQMEALTSSFTRFSNAYQANSLMGQYVEVTDESGNTDYGYVDYVNLNEKDGASVSVNGTLRPVSQVTKVFPANEAVTDEIKQNTSDIKDKLETIAGGIVNLADKIAQYMGKDNIEEVVDDIID